jgi:hypothetical protein
MRLSTLQASLVSGASGIRGIEANEANKATAAKASLEVVRCLKRQESMRERCETLSNAAWISKGVGIVLLYNHLAMDQVGQGSMAVEDFEKPRLQRVPARGVGRARNGSQ